MEHEGASPGELLIEAARRNNTDLLKEVIDGCESAEKAAVLLNETKTVLGNYIYHEAALRGNYEIIDMLLDQEGFECDPINRIEGDTPLHSAIRYINSLTESQPNNPDITSFAQELVSMMIEAGSDARIRNKANLTPIQLTNPQNVALRNQLQDALDISLNQGDFVVEEDDKDQDEDYAGSGSDSDFDPEEYKREKERRLKEKAALANGVAPSS